MLESGLFVLFKYFETEFQLRNKHLANDSIRCQAGCNLVGGYVFGHDFKLLYRYVFVNDIPLSIACELDSM